MSRKRSAVITVITVGVVAPVAVVIGVLAGPGASATTTPARREPASPSALPRPIPPATPRPVAARLLAPRPLAPRPVAPPPVPARPVAGPAVAGRGAAHPSAAAPASTRPRPTHPGPSRPRRGTVYLTFDDGPSAITTRVLRTLTAHDATATFFELGVEQQRFPSVSAAVVRQGSVVGNHTYDHRDLTTLGADGVRRELAGGPASRCVRPPYGATDALVRQVIESGGQHQVLWTIDTRDWSRPGTATIRARALDGVRSGSIVLMHDGGGDRSQTLAALPGVLDELARDGYRVAALPGC
jgi:peptidoglycan/xylan/chitin deacetylase (PgdA/CDA1 family)